MRRKLSYDVLYEIIEEGKHAHLVLKNIDVPTQDHAWISALVYTVLQNKLYLEYQFEDLIKANTDASFRIVFLMAAAQWFKMDPIPEYALVNEMVDLTKEIGKKHTAGFVNAVLKKMISRNERPYEQEGLQRASIEYSIPLWILKLLERQYSESFSMRYAQYCQTIKPTYVWVNPFVDYEIDDSLFLSRNPDIASPDLFRSVALEKSKVVVQDINSQAVIDSIPLEEGMSVLDCCCAPGTKTLRIASALKNTGKIVGVDLIQPRVKVTQELMQRANVKNATILQGDATEVSFDTLFDVVLVDAPCSGLGVIAHKHDLRYNIQPDDLDALQIIQKEILDNVSQYVKVGGRLVYATCTLNKKENEKQIEAFLKRNESFECVFERTYDPVETQGDGFYVAHCIRKW